MIPSCQLFLNEWFLSSKEKGGREVTENERLSHMKGQKQNKATFTREDFAQYFAVILGSQNEEQIQNTEVVQIFP